MRILNATNRTITIMLDNGDFLSVKPGEFSVNVIASKSLILSVIRAGNEKEVGIVISSSYELDIARQVTGSIPFIYHSDREAKAKLLGNLNDEEEVQHESDLNPLQITVDKLIIERDEIKKQCDTLIEEKKSLEDEISRMKQSEDSSVINKKMSTLEKQLESQSSRIKELETSVKDKDIQIESLTSKNQKLNSEISNLKASNESLGKQLSEIKLELDIKSEELEKMRQSKSSEKDTSEKIQGYKDKISQLENEISGLKAVINENTSLIDTLKSEGKSAVETIESMKAEFNAACKKFNLYKKDGVWYMKDSERSEE